MKQTNSRQGSVIALTEKVSYPKCEKKKQHAKQSLNYVCLTVGCKSRGLICVICKSMADHTGHNVQPVKSFLAKLEQSIKKSQATNASKMAEEQMLKNTNQHSLMQRLEQSHLQILSTLRIQVGEIAQRIRKIEQQIIMEYEKVRERIANQYDKQILVQKSILEIKSYLSEQKQKEAGCDIRLSVMKLLCLLKIQKNQFFVANEAENQFNAYNLNVGSFKTNMMIWQRETINIIEDVFRVKPQYQIRDNKNRPLTAADTVKPTALAFSPQFKTESIVLSNENKMAKLKDQKNGKIILLNEKVVDCKNNSIKLKIGQLSVASSLQIGLCLKGHITQKAFKFQKSSIMHGGYFFSSNGFVFAHNDQTVNNTKTNFLFKANDELSVEVDQAQSKLVVRKKGDPKPHELLLKILDEKDWDDLYFGVCLNGVGDKLQILN